MASFFQEDEDLNTSLNDEHEDTSYNFDPAEEPPAEPTCPANVQDQIHVQKK